METTKAKVFYLSQRVPSQPCSTSHQTWCWCLTATAGSSRQTCGLRVCGVERDNIIGKSVEESYWRVRSSADTGRITDALSGSEVVEELRFLRHAEELFFRVKFLPTVFNDGTPGVTIILEDITEGRRAEEALRESEMLFRSLVENINDLILNVDETCAFTYVSPKSREILGYAPEEMLGKTPCDFMAPEKAERVRVQLAALLADPRPGFSLSGQCSTVTGAPSPLR